MSEIEKLFEYHPWEPYIPVGAKVLIMGTFPPPRARWSMDFYYPNRTNDFWYMMGLIFYGDRYYLTDESRKNFNVEAIKKLLNDKKIALNDTGHKVHRQKGNASDKFLEIVEPVPLFDLLEKMPDCRAIATTGEKAAEVIASLTETTAPKMGEKISAVLKLKKTGQNRAIDIWRMPSTSRAYPLALDKKAEYYKRLFESLDIVK